MRSAARRLPALVLLALCAACAGRRPSAVHARADHNVLTEAQLLEQGFHNAFEAVEALRSNWLQARGPDSFSSPTPVWVYLDGTRLGGVESLRLITLPGIAYIRYFDGLAASARWGLGHGQGVIFVSTHL